MLLVNSIYASVPESSICCGTRLKKAVYRSNRIIQNSESYKQEAND